MRGGSFQYTLFDRRCFDLYQSLTWCGENCRSGSMGSSGIRRSHGETAWRLVTRRALVAARLRSAGRISGRRCSSSAPSPIGMGCSRRGGVLQAPMRADSGPVKSPVSTARRNCAVRCWGVDITLSSVMSTARLQHACLPDFSGAAVRASRTHCRAPLMAWSTCSSRPGSTLYGKISE